MGVVYLFMHSGRAKMPVIKAAYANVEEADAQAQHNIARDYQRPIKITEDEQGQKVLRVYQE